MQMTEQQPLSSSADAAGADSETGVEREGAHDKQARHKESVEFYAAMYEIVGALLIPLLLAPLAAETDLLLTQIVGIAFLAVYAWWSALIIWLFCRGYCKHSIYRIYTETAVPQNWIPMNIAYHNKEYRQQPICSISEFSAIAGGIAKMSLTRLGSYGWAMIATYLGFQLRAQSDHLPRGLWAEVVAAFGVFLIGIFYYDPFSWKLQIGHFVGILLSLAAFVGLFQQRIEAGTHIWLPSVLTALFVLFYVIFWITGGKSSDDPQTVSMYSFRSIMLEFGALTSIAVAIGLWFILVTAD